jgi:hypothetical protein
MGKAAADQVLDLGIGCREVILMPLHVGPLRAWPFKKAPPRQHSGLSRNSAGDGEPCLQIVGHCANPLSCRMAAAKLPNIHIYRFTTVRSQVLCRKRFAKVTEVILY